MFELLLVGLTLVFVAYFLYSVYKTVTETNASHETHFVAPAEPAETAAQGGESAVDEPTAQVEAAVAEAVTVAEAPAAPVVEEEKVIVLRNPQSGETTPVPSNYRFAKKWVKEALVAEGLLTKVYKNSELQGSVASEVKKALEKFKNIEKYQA